MNNRCTVALWPTQLCGGVAAGLLLPNTKGDHLHCSPPLLLPPSRRRHTQAGRQARQTALPT